MLRTVSAPLTWCIAALVVGLVCTSTPGPTSTPARDNRSIRVLNGADFRNVSYCLGDTLDILFSADTPRVNHVSVFLSLDAGKRWIMISDDNDLYVWSPGWGHFSWPIPATLQIYDFVALKDTLIAPVSDSCALMLERYDAVDTVDRVTTSGYFAIRPK